MTDGKGAARGDAEGAKKSSAEGECVTQILLDSANPLTKQLTTTTKE